jgi:hypothetical protein
MVAQRPYIIYKLPISRVTQALIGGNRKGLEKYRRLLTNLYYC